MRGKFITVEGIEGAGKSTCVAVIEDVLKERGINEIVHTREPGGTKIAERLREILLTPGEEKVFDETELLLMYAARRQLVGTVIEPALKSGKWVIGDRHDLSTFAYQGGGRGMDAEMIDGLRKIALGGFMPDLTILMDIDPELGLSRVDKRGQGRDRFEQEKVEFFNRVRQAYLDAARADTKRIIVIDASRSLENVKEAIRRAAEEFLCSLG